MPKPMTESEVTMATCFAIMSSWQFKYDKRLEWTIWAARHQVCPTCGAQQGFPCINMADRRRGVTPRQNKRPHDERVDWGRLLAGLKSRGYYRPAIENQVRKIAEGRATANEIDDRPDDMPEWAKGS